MAAAAVLYWFVRSGSSANTREPFRPLELHFEVVELNDAVQQQVAGFAYFVAIVFAVYQCSLLFTRALMCVVRSEHNCTLIAVTVNIFTLILGAGMMK